MYLLHFFQNTKEIFCTCHTSCAAHDFILVSCMQICVMYANSISESENIRVYSFHNIKILLIFREIEQTDVIQAKDLTIVHCKFNLAVMTP